MVSMMNNEHNHEINEKLFKYLPKQRHLSSKERQDVENMLKVKANKKMLQNYVMQKTGKNVILKDLHNIQSNIKKKDKDINKGPLEQVHAIFSERPGAIVEYITDDNNLKAIFFQDETMKSSFRNFPEVILVDATYKTNNMRMPLYFILSVDGNGQSEIVALLTLSADTRGRNYVVIGYRTFQKSQFFLERCKSYLDR
jgi:zinc finger SWIM domain-containing protein 3